jgi:hypothetical protein
MNLAPRAKSLKKKQDQNLPSLFFNFCRPPYGHDVQNL